MFRIEASRQSSTYCDGMSRRSFLQIGIAGVANASLADVLRAKNASERLGHAKKDTSVILIWLDGGPSHMDLWDMKPDAPAEYRGLWQPIGTNVSGLDISEFFPKKARNADKFSIVRSLCNNQTHHEPASRQMLTGRDNRGADNKRAKYPSIGSIATKVCGRAAQEYHPISQFPWHRPLVTCPAISARAIWASNTIPFKRAVIQILLISRSRTSRHQVASTLNASKIARGYANNLTTGTGK